MRNDILNLAIDTLNYLQKECDNRQLSDDVIDQVREVILATTPPYKVFIKD